MADSPPPGWQTIRDKQPSWLHMTIKLPKDHYFQGEEIDATVTFANDDPSKLYELELMSIPWIVNFHAFDEAGHEAVNPIEWYYGWYGIMYCGAVQVERWAPTPLRFPSIGPRDSIIPASTEFMARDSSWRSRPGRSPRRYRSFPIL